MKVKNESEVAHSRPTLSDPMDCTLLSMAFSRQEYWSGVPLPSPPNNAKYINISSTFHFLSSVFFSFGDLFLEGQIFKLGNVIFFIEVELI